MVSCPDTRTVSGHETTPCLGMSIGVWLLPKVIRLAEKVRYIEDSSFEQSAPDSLDPSIPQGGFECQFVENPPENVQYECPVCQLVAVARTSAERASSEFKLMRSHAQLVIRLVSPPYPIRNFGVHFTPSTSSALTRKRAASGLINWGS